MQSTLPDKTKKERFFHALMFELIALIICSPLLALIMDKPLAEMGALTLMVSICAMVINMIFNTIFDHIEKRLGWVRTVKIRILHAVSFEVSLLIVIVPLAAWWLNISLYEALIMDIGLLLFFLPYTYIYNWAYDHLRFKYYQKKTNH